VIKSNQPSATRLIRTPLGEFTATFSSVGLKELKFPSNSSQEDSGEVPAAWLEQTRSAISAVLNGTSPPTLPPLDLSSGSEFQQTVWKALLEIQTGQTACYSEIATQIGRPAAVRAVGGACGANPIPVLIPCHRVLAKGQKLGGFSAGLDWKKRLLEIEQVQFKTN
jgi:methylated-DNA-[protein]-cysteine S-methyltransferase